MPFGCFASSGTSPVAELADRDASAITGDAFRRLSAPTLPAPVQQSPVGDALPAFVGARRTSLHQRGSIAPAREHDARGKGGGFAPLEASCRRVAGVSRLYWCNSPRLAVPSTWAELDRAPLTAQFLPFGGGEVAVRGGEAPASQTTSANNAKNGESRAMWSASWTHRCLASCVARTRTRYCER